MRCASFKRAGFTFVEMMIALVILTIIAGTIAVVSKTGTGTFRSSVANETVNSKLRRAIQRIAKDLSGSSTATLVPAPFAPLGSSSLTFQQAVGYESGAAVWGPNVQFQFEYAPLELDNDIDDDGNGLVDEGILVRIENPGAANESRTLICTGVSEYGLDEIPNGIDDNGDGFIDERGVAFALDGDALTVRITIEHMGSEQEVLQQSSETTVLLRN